MKRSMGRKGKTGSLRSIGFRHAILVSGLLMATMGLIGYLETYRENQSLATEMENKAELLQRSVSNQYIDAIVKGDEVAISKLTHQLWRTQELESVSLYDDSGRCIWHLYSYLKDSQLLDEDKLKKLKDSERFLLSRTPLRNGRVYETIIPLNRKEKLYGYLKIDYSLREFYDKLKASYYLLGMVAGVFVVASILWAWLTSNTILRPVDLLTKGVKKVSQGDFSAHIPSSSSVELAALTENFNQMVTELGNTRVELNHYQASLEENIKRIRAELEETHRKLLHSEKLAGIGQLAAGVAHEINNPLTSIRMLSQLLLDRMNQGENQKNLEEVLNQSLRCQKIVAGLLSFARDRKVHYRIVDVNSILKNSLNLLINQKTLNRIELARNLTAEPIFVEGDPEQIEEVFTNIMLNAVDSVDEEGKVTVESSVTDGVAKIAISDTGCGIPEENLNKIFDPFYTSTNDHQGTGLGLSVSYGIVQEHEGTIEVESQPGKGSTFTVCLPRKGAEKNNVQKSK